jgi:hypothetical protein
MEFSTAIHFFNVLIFLLIALSVLACYTMLRTKIRYGIKYLVVPVILAITFMIAFSSKDYLGRPYPAQPIGEFDFKYYRVVFENDKKLIEVLVVQDNKSRLYVMPYSENLERKLAKAASSVREGSRVVAKMKNNNRDMEADEIIIYEITTNQALPPKD